MLESLYRFHSHVVNNSRPTHRRYLATQIDWQEKAIMIVGDRGVGKTTLLIQHANEHYQSIKDWLYISGDFFPLAEIGLYNAIEEYFTQTAAHCVVIDEVHQYPNWKLELKNILDAFPSKSILISGSSSLHLLEGSDKQNLQSQRSTTDLQRRRTLYELKPLSFREYLDFRWDLKQQPIQLAELIENADELSQNIVSTLMDRDTTVLKEFEDYLSYGYYPYFLTATQSYSLRLQQTIHSVISSDIALAMELNVEGVQKIRKLLTLIASSKPMTPNINALARELGASRDTVYRYISYLEKASLIRTIFTDISKAGHILSRPDKICISNPNILQICFDVRLGSEHRGALRESFFVSNFAKDKITCAQGGDFCIAAFTFEIGGPSKGMEQIKGKAKSYLVKDGQELPAARSLPLWLFGFLY